MYIDDITYNPNTGDFFRGGRQLATNITHDKHITIRVKDTFGKWTQVSAQKLAWRITYGMWPPTHTNLELSHNDGNKQNNRKRNISLLPKRQNMINLNDPLYTSNTTGVRGVSYMKTKGAFRAYVTTDSGKRIFRTFSIQAHGHQKAFRKAVEARFQMERDNGYWR